MRTATFSPENVPYIVGLGEACRLSAGRLAGAGQLRAPTRDLLARLQRAVPALVPVGDPEDRLPNTLNVLFPGVPGRRVLENCPRRDGADRLGMPR